MSSADFLVRRPSGNSLQRVECPGVVCGFFGYVLSQNTWGSLRVTHRKSARWSIRTVSWLIFIL